MAKSKSKTKAVDRFTVYLPVDYTKRINKWKSLIKKKTKANRVSKSEIIRRALDQFDPSKEPDIESG